MNSTLGDIEENNHKSINNVFISRINWFSDKLLSIILDLINLFIKNIIINK
jgi:hypothetical protein